MFCVHYVYLQLYTVHPGVKLKCVLNCKIYTPRRKTFTESCPKLPLCNCTILPLNKYECIICT
jgi:hypothetical protein